MAIYSFIGDTVLIDSGSISGSLAGTASYALFAEYALNGGGGSGSLPIIGTENNTVRFNSTGELEETDLIQISTINDEIIFTSNSGSLNINNLSINSTNLNINSTDILIQNSLFKTENTTDVVISGGTLQLGESNDNYGNLILHSGIGQDDSFTVSYPGSLNSGSGLKNLSINGTDFSNDDGTILVGDGTNWSFRNISTYIDSGLQIPINENYSGLDGTSAFTLNLEDTINETPSYISLIKLIMKGGDNIYGNIGLQIANMSGGETHFPLIIKDGDPITNINQVNPSNNRFSIIDYISYFGGLYNPGQPASLVGGIQLNAVDNTIKLHNPFNIANNSTISWNTITPPLSGNSGKFLSNNGTIVSWETVPTGSGSSLSDGNKGDITISGSGSIFTLNNNVVSTDKLVDGSITNIKISSGVDATKIADGSISNTEFQYLNNLSGSIQTQIDSKQNILTSGSITTELIANGNVTLAKLNSTGATSGQVPTYNGTNIAWATPSGSLPFLQNSVTLSGNVIYEKADFNGSNILFLSTNNTTTRTLTISNTGFVANDMIMLLINQNSSGYIDVTLGSRSIQNNRGNIINAIFDGTNWHVWSGGGVFNTSNSGFTRTSFGLGAATLATNCSAFGNRSIAGSDSFSNASAFGAIAQSIHNDTVAIGVSSLANSAQSTAVGRSARASSGVGAGNALGAYTNTNNFARSNAFSAYTVNRRYGSTRLHLGLTTDTFDATNPSENKEWTTWNGTTSNDTITEIFLRGVSSNRCVLQAKNAISFKGQAVAFRSDYTGTARWDIEGLIKRDGSNNTTLVGVTTTLTHSDGTGGTLVLTIDADDTNEALRVQVTGNASETWTWLVELELLDLRIA